MTKKQIIKELIDCFKRGNKVLIAGNGGSASMSQHWAAEFVCKFEKERRALPAISLTTNGSILTAWSNDCNFNRVFSRQVEALGNKGDILIGISTSGRSLNVKYALKTAKLKEMVCIDLPRLGVGTARIQEFQLRLMHNITREVEKEFI